MTFSLSQPPQEVVFRETSISGLIFVRTQGAAVLCKTSYKRGGLAKTEPDDNCVVWGGDDRKERDVMIDAKCMMKDKG